MPILEVPWRSPLVVVEAIKDIIKDKVVCELECAAGDLMVEMKKYAKDVVGMELNPDRVLAAKARGLDVVEGDVFTNHIPDADVYYIWCDATMIGSIPSIIKKGIWIIASDVPVDERIDEFEAIVNLRLNGYWIDVPYDEGECWRQRGIMKLFVTEVL